MTGNEEDLEPPQETDEKIQEDQDQDEPQEAG